LIYYSKAKIFKRNPTEDNYLLDFLKVLKEFGNLKRG